MAQNEAAITEAGFALGRRIRELREGRELSQEALAYLSGTSRQTIAQIETHGREPRYWTAYRIAQVLGVTLDDLAGPSPKVESVVVEVFPRRLSNSASSSSTKRAGAARSKIPGAGPWLEAA